MTAVSTIMIRCMVDNLPFASAQKSFEIAGLVSPQPKVGDLLVVKFRVADMAVARDQYHMGAARGGGVLGAHEHLAFVFQTITTHPVAFVVFTGDQQYADGFQPVGIGLLQMIEIFFARQSGALGILFENA